MLSRFFKKEKSNVKTQAPKSRRLRMERLEDRALLSVTPTEYAGIRELYSSFELSENMADVNAIDLSAAVASEQVQAALDAAKATPQDDLIVLRVNSDNHTLTLDGNPLVVDVAPENGGVYIVALADDGANVSLTVDTQNMSRAFSVLRGDVGLANMDIYGQTWSFDQGAAYDGLIRVRNVADLTVENVEIWAAPTASDSPVMGEEEAQGLPGELLVPNADWSLAEPSSDVALSVAGVPTSVSVSAPSAVVAEGPYGAGQYDTSLYMAGNVAVTLAIMESNGAVDASVCNWSTSQINAVKTRTREALDWWETMFDKYNPNSPIGLSFTVDYTDATTPFQTSYEPIMHAGSSEEDLWGCEYLASKGYAATDSTYWNTMCSYNADIRNKTGADWAYTIIVVHSRDPQGNLVGSSSVPGDFAGGGAGAYAWYGGANMLASYDCRGWGIGRMNYTIAHETGHIFHAPDEYEGSGSYYDVSGYYGIQNLNAIEDNPNPDACVPSIMNGEQDYAWKNYTSSPTSLQTIGWRDSDGDGLIDALDTPLILTGRGKYDAGQKTFTFAGKSSVTALENAMTKSDVTLNTVDRLEYKLDDGAWTTLATVSGTSNVSVGGVVNIGDAKLISFRTVCDRTGVTSATLTFNPLDPFNPLDDPLRVTTALDVVDDTDGVISLREALAVAHEGDAVTFAASLKGQTITLNGSEIELSNAVTVDASALWDATTETPGLTIDAGKNSRVFHVTGGTADVPVELIGLKIANGLEIHGSGLKVDAGAALLAKDCFFVDNKTTNTGGGGLCVDGWANLENCVVSGNSAATDGGGIFVAATGSLTAIGLTVDGNSAAGNGGGIYVDGTATLAKTTISGNAATNQGGGLHVGGATTLEKATISGNSAAWGGGAVVWNNLTLTNSLVVENEATSGGGGFYVGGTAILRNATIAANKAGWGGGLQVGGEEGTTTLYNAILATNVGGDVADGATLNAYNVLSSHTKWDAGSNYYVYNASLPLFKDAANGDYRLADGSQAVDKGNDAHAVDADGNAFPTDLAGNVRFNGTVDLGAYELQGATETPSLVVTTAADVVNINDGLISLREAIQYAAACARLGGVVTFDASLKGATITLSGTELAISQAVTIDASALGDATTKTPGLTLNADGKSRVFNVTGGTEEAPVALLGLTITGGVASYAGGVFVAPNAFLSAQNVVFTGNKTTLSGGGGLCVDGAASLENCDFIGNQGGSGGGICVALTASLTVKGGSFVDNVAAGYGGGGVEIEREAKVVISNATFTGNSAAYGGALHVVGSLTADNLTINGNSGTGSAGVDVDASGTLTLENSTITNNTATNAAGGLYVGGWATVRRVTISGNSAANGGGVYVAGTLTATDVTISDNAASDQGGGLRVNGASTLENATISGNSAEWGGGAIVWGSLTLANSLVVENSAKSGGGGFYVGGKATFRNATIAANKAGWGGGLQASSDETTTLYNTILATNVGGDVVDGATLKAYNVLSSHTAWDAGSNNYVYNASQPLFKDAANGNYTLSLGSQAVDKGNNSHISGYSTDLAGETRVVNKTVDLGAYEYWQAERLSSPSLSVSALDATSLSVKIGSVANASGYVLEYSPTSDFATKQTQTFAASGTYSLTGLSANTTYYVRVLANGDGASYLDSVWSSVESSTTLKIALTGVTLSGAAKVGETLTASVSPNGATVGWQWYVGSDATSVTTAISGATSPAFTITSAYVGQYLKVVATGTGDYRGSVSATVDLVPPTAPTDVKFGAYDASAKNATLTWTDNATNEVRYEARYSVDDGATWKTLANLAANATSRVCDDLNVGETYIFQIRAVAANELASDWASAKFFVQAIFGASEYVVEQNCAFYLSATGASDHALTHYWDLSGSEVEESSNFIERDAGFWTSPEELGLDVGEHSVRMRSRDANGDFGSTVVATLRVVATQPIFNVTTSSSVDGSILRLNLQATTPNGSPIARWRFDWGDGQTSDFAELSDALTAGHYYAPTDEDAVYEVSLTALDATGAGADVVYALTSHKVAGSGAASQAAAESSDKETTLSGDAANGCVAEIVDVVATANGTKGDSMSQTDRTAQASARRVGVKALSDGEIWSDSKRFERVDLTATSVSAVLAEEFDELDFFIDEDELDALAKRFVRR